MFCNTLYLSNNVIFRRGEKRERKRKGFAAHLNFSPAHIPMASHKYLHRTFREYIISSVGYNTFSFETKLTAEAAANIKMPFEIPSLKC